MTSGDVTEAVRNFLLAESWEASRAVVEADPDLFSGEVREFMTSLVASARAGGDEQMAARLEEHVAMLESWTHDETSHRIASLADGSLDAILHELARPASPAEMPFRIELCRQALSRISRETDIELWGLLQSVLGTSLLSSQMGDDAANLEQAIEAYGIALDTLKDTDLVLERARILNNLGRAYERRGRDSSDDDLRLAIEAYEAAADIFRSSDANLDLAQCLVNLGNATLHAQARDREDARERAIALYREADERLSRDDEPFVWAQIQANLGIALTDRARGRREQNLELAISSLENALTVLDPTTTPIPWAQAQASLGNALRACSVDGGEDIERAIVVYSTAVEVFAQYGAMAQRAVTLTNLGRAFETRALGDRAANIEQAIECHSTALELIDSKTNALEWSLASNNLGSALRVRLVGDRAENVEAAIAAIEAALAVLERLDRPLDYAQAQKNLGAAYAKRVNGDENENLQRAKAAYELALKERERVYGDSHPRVASVLYSMAKVQRRLGDSQAARASLERAVAIDEEHSHANRARLGRRYRKLADTAAEAGDREAAVRAMQRAVTLDETTRGVTDQEVLRDLQQLAYHLQAVERIDEAAIAVERAATIERLLLGPRHPRVRNTLVQLTEALQRAGELAAAEELRRRTAAIDSATSPGRLPGRSSYRVAKMLAQLGRLAEEITDAAADDRTRRRAEGFADSGLTRNRPRIAATVALLEQLSDRRPRGLLRRTPELPAGDDVTASAQAVPTSLRFRETMAGELAGGLGAASGDGERAFGEKSQIELDVTIEIDDLERFLAEPDCVASATGTLSIEPTHSARAIESGTFNVTPDREALTRHQVRFTLPFTASDGTELVLSATRLIDDEDGDKLVIATMMSDVSITLRGDVDGDPLAVGTVRTGHVDTIRELASFHATGPEDAAQSIDRLGWMMMRELWSTHVTRMALTEEGSGRRSASMALNAG